MGLRPTQGNENRPGPLSAPMNRYPFLSSRPSGGTCGSAIRRGNVFRPSGVEKSRRDATFRSLASGGIPFPSSS